MATYKDNLMFGTGLLSDAQEVKVLDMVPMVMWISHVEIMSIDGLSCFVDSHLKTKAGISKLFSKESIVKALDREGISRRPLGVGASEAYNGGSVDLCPIMAILGEETRNLGEVTCFLRITRSL